MGLSEDIHFRPCGHTQRNAETNRFRRDSSLETPAARNLLEGGSNRVGLKRVELAGPVGFAHRGSRYAIRSQHASRPGHERGWGFGRSQGRGRECDGSPAKIARRAGSRLHAGLPVDSCRFHAIDLPGGIRYGSGP